MPFTSVSIEIKLLQTYSLPIEILDSSKSFTCKITDVKGMVYHGFQREEQSLNLSAWLFLSRQLCYVFSPWKGPHVPEARLLPITSTVATFSSNESSICICTHESRRLSYYCLSNMVTQHLNLRFFQFICEGKLQSLNWMWFLPGCFIIFFRTSWTFSTSFRSFAMLTHCDGTCNVFGTCSKHVCIIHHQSCYFLHSHCRRSHFCVEVVHLLERRVTGTIYLFLVLFQEMSTSQLLSITR